MNPDHENVKYTGYGWECMPQSTEDERKPSGQQPARPGTEGTQKGSKRSIMLSDQVIDRPARLTIEVFLELRKDLSSLTQESLGEDAKVIFHWYLELQSQLQPPPKRTELEKYAQDLSSLFASMFVENYSQYIIQDLTYDTRLKLAIIYWHFDDPGLVRGFLRSPINKEVWEGLYADYLTYSQQDITYLEFIQSFEFLLSPQLPKRLASPKLRGSARHTSRTLAKRRHHPVSIPRSQSTSLLSSLPPRPDANDRPTLPPIHEVLKGVCPDFLNAMFVRDITSQPTSGLERHTSTTQSKLTMNDRDSLMSHTNVYLQDRLHPPQTRAKQKVRFELPLR
ncbi:hypothetical protein PMG11_04301 [Penicillium brasilianum]|uniref:Uncharacterized protein n=1 Tax=Penicillium brasilianum TaxID=104259 RepID=A0A0F7VCB0_PENBI|nr:hypothetical protein PMG11_04301 [Penicillium brasilianum]